MPDVEIPCVQCRKSFLFTEKEQENFYQRNMTPPQRCSNCRPKKTSADQHGADQHGAARYDIICDHCGKPDRVPFQPKTGRSVLCRECHQASKSRVRMA